jgi:hypothetical protein
MTRMMKTVTDGRTAVGILSKYKIIKDPPSDDWHQLGSYGEPASAPLNSGLRIRMCHLAKELHSNKKTSEFSTFNLQRDMLLMPFWKLILTGT